MEALTPAERRGALVVALLLAIGAGHDLWRASRPLPVETPGAISPGAAALAPSATPSGEAPGAGADAPAPVARLDLNRAAARELDALPGIGPVLAARIVAHRERHGPFASSEELLAVRGIGPRLFARLRPYVATAAERFPTVPPRADSVATPGRAPPARARHRGALHSAPHTNP